ncbi:MAG: hypothetical protein A3J28_01605 [Acidobacteria bacterium RIFCSPLOWO2_12_FULL_60_22]|nr:MAG: hypothetical protein A3J28_01605 [Acidobacteria bacterium RIFCSPLOWO2_12_FULL_60_22]
MSSAIQRMFAVVVTALIVLLLTASALAQGPGQAPGQGQAQASPLGRWVKLAPVPEKNEEFSFGAANGKLYVIGGNGEGPKGLVMEYDPAADKWTKKKNMPLPSDHLAVAEYRGKLYVFGGATQLPPNPGNIPLNNAWEYDPAADSWKALAPMPTRRISAVAAEVGGKIYVLGGAGHHPGAKDPAAPIVGNTPHRSLDTNEVYDPATNRWETRMTLPTARNHCAIGVVNGKIYLIGGRVGALNISVSTNTNIVEVYDPAIDSWGAAGMRMPVVGSGFGWGTYRGRIFVVGGETYDNHIFSAIRAVQSYDPATNTWTRYPSLPLARHGISVAVIGNRLIVAGGHIQGAGTAGAAAHSDETDAFEFTDK